MTAEKFLAIYSKVSGAVSIADNAEIRIEYGDASSPAIHYHVASLKQENDKLLVYLSQPGVTCKAKNRILESIPLPNTVLEIASACCDGAVGKTAESFVQKTNCC
jgi:hypothetical protein